MGDRDSQEAKTRKIQTDVVDRWVKWARASGATFEANKTAFIHFTRNVSKTADSPLENDGKLVKPKTEIKIS